LLGGIRRAAGQLGQVQPELGVGGVGDGVAIVVAGADPAALLDPEDAAGTGHVGPRVPSRGRESKELGGPLEAGAGSRAHTLELDQGETDPGVVVVVAVAAEPRPDRI
jgi:hypothetical protein